MTEIEKLLMISSEALAPPPVRKPLLLSHSVLGGEVFDMLRRKNGFYAFGPALHLFPITDQDEFNLESWNSESLWRNSYKQLPANLIFFGEDIFQDQFCISPSGVLRFKAETGQTVWMADSLEKWAEVILSDYEYETGSTTVNEWVAKYQSIAHGKRLMAITPFFLGGEYSLENLWEGSAVEGLRAKADIVAQTRELPDGAKVRLVIQRNPHEY